MKELNLSETLRYMCVGYVSFGLLYICEKEKALELLKDMGIIGISFFTFLVGSLVYLIYKPTLYHHIIIPVQDISRKNSNNYRTYLMKKYNMNTYQARFFWFYLTSKFKDKQDYLEKESSGTHLIYMSGFISFFFAIWQLIDRNYKIAGILLFCSIVFEFSAFIYDRYLEDFEYTLLRSIPDSELDEESKKFGFRQLINPNLI